MSASSWAQGQTSEFISWKRPAIDLFKGVYLRYSSTDPLFSGFDANILCSVSKTKEKVSPKISIWISAFYGFLKVLKLRFLVICDSK